MFHAEDVYYTLLGEFVDGAGVPGVENLFAPGSPCDANYAKMLEAYARLCRRLGREEEDEDIEIIINAFLENQRIIALKMYEYGAENPPVVRPGFCYDKGKFQFVEQIKPSPLGKVARRRRDGRGINALRFRQSVIIFVTFFCYLSRPHGRSATLPKGEGLGAINSNLKSNLTSAAQKGRTTGPPFWIIT